MNRRVHIFWAILACGAIASSGCHPQQPFYMHEDGDLSHYIDVATEIEYPDVCTVPLEEVTKAAPPLTLDNLEFKEYWDLTLEEAIRTSLENSKVFRSLGGRYVTSAFNNRAQTGDAPDSITVSPAQLPRTVYDPAITETAPFTGVEYALAAFDTQWNTNLFFNHNDRQQNVLPTFPITDFFRQVFEQETSTFNTQLVKTTAQGGLFSVRNNIVYDLNNNPTRQVAKDWNVNYELAFQQPLLAGAGAQFNRIAGPFNPFNVLNITGAQQTPGFDGVLLARINVDISLADFEEGVRNLLSDVENAYWELSFAWRNLETSNTALASARQTWRKVYLLYEVGLKGGEAAQEAQAREQFFQFMSLTQTALNELMRAENRLRYIMGISSSDCRFIRPTTRPTVARVDFDFCEITEEALGRNLDLRRQKWRIKQRELELIAAKNLVMPRLDLTGTYRFLGLGDNLLGANRTAFTPSDPLALTGSYALQTLATGQFQEWQLGAQMTMPIGMRKELSTVRHYELQLARERAKLQDLELELSHQLTDAVRQLTLNYELTQTNFNRTLAATRQVNAVREAFEAETITLDQLLEAQRRRAEAQSSFFRTLLDYQRGIIMVHYRKGSLLEYNSVYLTEGPWPCKAEFDAHRLARQRDAGKYINYGYTRPAVMSQGPINQGVGGHEYHGEGAEFVPTDGVPHEATTPEEIPAPRSEELPAPSSEPLPTPTSFEPTALDSRDNAESPAAMAEMADLAGAPAGKGDFEWGTLGLDSDDSQSTAGTARRSARPSPGKNNQRSSTGKSVAAPASRVVSAPARTASDSRDAQPERRLQWKPSAQHEPVENQSSGPALRSATSGQGP